MTPPIIALHPESMGTVIQRHSLTLWLTLLQATYCCGVLDLDPAKVNPNGGAIAMGHPLGATGVCAQTAALLYIGQELRRQHLQLDCFHG